MSAVAVPASASEDLQLLESLLARLARRDAEEQPAEVVAEVLRVLERLGAGPGPPGADCGAGRGLGADQVGGPAAGQVDPAHPGRIPQ